MCIAAQPQQIELHWKLRHNPFCNLLLMSIFQQRIAYSTHCLSSLAMCWLQSHHSLYLTWIQLHYFCGRFIRSSLWDKRKREVLVCHPQIPKSTLCIGVCWERPWQALITGERGWEWPTKIYRFVATNTGSSAWQSFYFSDLKPTPSVKRIIIRIVIIIK